MAVIIVVRLIMFEDDLDKAWQQRKALAAKIAQQASLEEDADVPNWHREAAFEQYSPQASAHSSHLPWWHRLGFTAGQGLAVTAFACSMSVIALLGVFVNNNAGVNQQAIAALVKAQLIEQLDIEVNRKLREFANEQQVILANYKAELSARQESSNLQLAGYVISSARDERKEDLSDFVSFINAQRKDEQLAQKIKFQQLEQAIGYRKANFQPSAQKPLIQNPSIQNQ